MNYYICEYCGKTATRRKKKIPPKCNCKEGNGKTFMTQQKKEIYALWRKNK